MHLYNPTAFGIRDGVSEADRPAADQHRRRQSELRRAVERPAGTGRYDDRRRRTPSACFSGRNSIKFGGEYRQFLSNSRRRVPALLTSPVLPRSSPEPRTLSALRWGTSRAASRRGRLEFFIQTNYRWTSHFTLELGLRYAWNMTPKERFGRFIAFDPASGSLEDVGQLGENIYHQNNKNFQPRVSFAWDPFEDGKTSVRGAYAIAVDQPMTSVVTPMSANPPLVDSADLRRHDPLR